MSTTIKLKGGPAATIPVLKDREPGFTTDTHQIYVGWHGTNYAIGGGSGSVSSVGLALPSSTFTVTVSPITTSGTLTATLKTQTANTFLAGPVSGGAATPDWRALDPTDYPIFGPSGVLHARGAVPDPGSSAGTSRYLREDGTWDSPATSTAPGLDSGERYASASSRTLSGTGFGFCSLTLPGSGIYLIQADVHTAITGATPGAAWITMAIYDFTAGGLVANSERSACWAEGGLMDGGYVPDLYLPDVWPSASGYVESNASLSLIYATDNAVTIDLLFSLGGTATEGQILSSSAGRTGLRYWKLADTPHTDGGYWPDAYFPGDYWPSTYFPKT